MSAIDKVAHHKINVLELAQYLGKLCKACRRLIEVHEAKIRAKIGEVWYQELRKNG